MTTNIPAPKQEVAIGIITPDSHSFSPFVRAFTEFTEIKDIHMLDARTGMAYVFLTKQVNGKTKKLYHRIGEEVKPVLNETKMRRVTLSKNAPLNVKDDWKLWVSNFLSFGIQEANLTFDMEV